MTKEARTYSGVKIVYSINGVGKTGQIACRKMKLDHLLIPHARISSKWIKDLNVRSQTIKIVEENTDRKIMDIAHSNILSGISPQERETREKINKWDYTKLTRFCTAKENINKIDNPQNGRTYSPIHLIRG